MIRHPLCRLACLALVLSVAGCAQLFATRTIEQFALGLQNQDLDLLKQNASEDFDHKALRQPDSARGLGVLSLPTGKVKLVTLDDLGDGHHRAIVAVGEKDSSQEIEYRLTKDAKTGKWVVDDIIMQQDTGRNQIVSRSVSDQMDLLLSCREVMMSWSTGDRERILSHCSPELAAELTALPDAWMKQLARELAPPNTHNTFQPDARLTGKSAFVNMEHPQGQLFLEMSQNGDRWQLRDMALEPSARDANGIRNLRKMAHALSQSNAFLTGYGAADAKLLEASATNDFFKKCLSAADLSEVSLPTAMLISGAYEARQFTDGGSAVKRLELLLKDNDKTYMLSLLATPSAAEESGAGDSEFRVEEVTIFSKDGRDVRRMSAIFLSRAMVNVYADALRNRDLTRLREVSSSDFNDRVWGRPEAKMFAIMAEPELSEGAPVVMNTLFRGDVTEVTVSIGDMPMTYILKSSRGWVVVDDVLLPASDRPTSLKANLEAMLPIHAFATALNSQNLEGLSQYSAEGLNRMAWQQIAAVPEFSKQLVRPLLSEVVSIKPQDDRLVVVTTDGQVNAEISLLRQGKRLVIADVNTYPTRRPQERLALLGTLRQQIASGELAPRKLRDSKVMTAVAEAPVPDSLPRSEDIPQPLAEPAAFPEPAGGIQPASAEIPSAMPAQFPAGEIQESPAAIAPRRAGF